MEVAATDELAEQVARLADRLRSLSEVRLARALPPHGSRAEAGRAMAQELADLAADLERRPRRTVPRLGDLAVGDQVAVTGTDLVAALDRSLQELPDDQAAGPRDESAASVRASVPDLTERLRALRLAL